MQPVRLASLADTVMEIRIVQKVLLFASRPFLANVKQISTPSREVMYLPFWAFG